MRRKPPESRCLESQEGEHTIFLSGGVGMFRSFIHGAARPRQMPERPLSTPRRITAAITAPLRRTKILHSTFFMIRYLKTVTSYYTNFLSHFYTNFLHESEKP